jgi:hypothetical protein
MIRTDLRISAKTPAEVAEKIQLMGWVNLRASEKALCKEQVHEVLPYLNAVEKKFIAALHNVVPRRTKRKYVGKAYIIEKHKAELTRKRKELAVKLNKMSAEEMSTWLANYDANKAASHSQNPLAS